METRPGPAFPEIQSALQIEAPIADRAVGHMGGLKWKGKILAPASPGRRNRRQGEGEGKRA